MASIRKHHGKWQVRYRDPSGKEVSKSFTFKADARAFDAKIESDKLRGLYIDPRGGSLPFAEWAETCLQARIGIRSATRARDESLLRVHVLSAFGSRPLAKIRRGEVQEWVKNLSTTHSPATVRECYRILASYFREAVDERLIGETPCYRITLPRKVRTERKFLNPEQIDALIEAAPQKHRALVLTAVFTGMRWSELAGLKRANLDMLRRQLTVSGVIERDGGSYRYVEETKTAASRRTITFAPTLALALASHLESAPPSEYVFPAQEGGFLRYDNFRTRVWDPSVERAGLNGFTFHELRHTHAAILIDQGANPLEVQRRLGHKDIGTTLNTYGHLFPNREDELNERFERAFSGSLVDQTWTKQASGTKLRAISAGQGTTSA